MARIEFRYTNRQFFNGCASVFFSIALLISLSYIVFNLNDFIESHPLEMVLLMLFVAFMLYSFVMKMRGGKELKSKIVLTDSSIIVNGTYRFLLTDLCLDEFISEHYHCFHLYTQDKSFTLYTNEKDDFIKKLLDSNIGKELFEIDQYEFEPNSATVMIKARSGRMLGFNLNNGTFSIFRYKEDDTEKPLFEPKYFIQTPGYKQK